MSKGRKRCTLVDEHGHRSSDSKYRIDEAYGNVYLWNEWQKAYVFHCKLAVFEPSPIGRWLGPGSEGDHDD